MPITLVFFFFLEDSDDTREAVTTRFLQSSDYMHNTEAWVSINLVFRWFSSYTKVRESNVGVDSFTLIHIMAKLMQ